MANFPLGALCVRCERPLPPGLRLVGPHYLCPPCQPLAEKESENCVCVLEGCQAPCRHRGTPGYHDVHRCADHPHMLGADYRCTRQRREHDCVVPACKHPRGFHSAPDKSLCRFHASLGSPPPKPLSPEK